MRHRLFLLSVGTYVLFGCSAALDYEVVGAESVLSGLKSADGWVQTQHEVRRLDTATIELTAAELSGAPGRVYYFGNHFEEK